MLYLTRARLSPDASTQALLPLLMRGDQTARGHHLVWSLMSDSADRGRDFLFRQTAGGSMFVLSDRMPAGAALWDHESVEVPSYAVGDRVQFSLRCSPVVRRKRDGRTIKRDPILERLGAMAVDERRGQRQHVAHEVLTEWLGRLGEAGGYRLEALTVDSYRQERVRRRGGSALISMADVTGVLTVTDPTALEVRMRKGFGTARAWGCGLMLTRQIGSVASERVGDVERYQ